MVKKAHFYRKLAKRKSAGFLSWLAEANLAIAEVRNELAGFLDTLAVQLQVAGRKEEARDAANEAAEARRRLSRCEPRLPSEEPCQPA